MGSESVGEIFRPERKNLGGPLPEPVRLFSNQSRGDPSYHKPEIWQVARSCHPIPQSWDVPLGLVWSPYLWRVNSSGGGLFKRPVILRIRGAFYLWCRFPMKSKFTLMADCACGHALANKGYLPGSSENIGTASLFPDDKLR
jgi:hypothetical protein